jgi:NFU1 iron-sulfur cluster scaffold homolog, mitochondrial
MSDAKPVPLIAIRAEVLVADPNTCKFTVSQVVHPGGPFFFDRAERAVGSPLPELLFGLPGVAHVLVAENVVTVGKLQDTAWPPLKTAIGAKIRSQLLSGVPAILEKAEGPHRRPTWGRSEADVRAAIQELLDGEVNRGIAGHGGNISIVDYQNGRLLIAMSGGCQGCASAQMTLRQGVEVMVRRIAPEVVEIVDTTDHAAGRTPFYPR